VTAAETPRGFFFFSVTTVNPGWRQYECVCRRIRLWDPATKHCRSAEITACGETIRRQISCTTSMATCRTRSGAGGSRGRPGRRRTCSAVTTHRWGLAARGRQSCWRPAGQGSHSGNVDRWLRERTEAPASDSGSPRDGMTAAREALALRLVDRLKGCRSRPSGRHPRLPRPPPSPPSRASRTTRRRRERLLAGERARTILFGHSHQSVRRPGPNGTSLVNQR